MYYGNLTELKVINELNETNLEYIGIFGLFNRYNIEIPFDKQVNIFIGENGLGKTTILNCIYFVLEKKFSRLCNIQFSEIKIKFKNDSKIYKISNADIREYNRSKGGVSYNRFINNRDLYTADIIEQIMFHHDDLVFDDNVEELERLAYELSRISDMPINIARDQVINYINTREIFPKSKRKASCIL